MGKRPKKSVVLFVVEGHSDILTFKTSISEIYEGIDDNINVEFAIIDKDKTSNGVAGGDPFSDSWATEDNIESKIYKRIVKPFLLDHKYYEKDISEIIQITDMDGVYIPDSAVVENFDCEKFTYNDDGIICNSINKALDRNKRKRNIMNKLFSVSSIKIKSKTIKYSLYFFSSNLDHFIHNNANLPLVDKTRKADEFSRKCSIEGIDYFFKLFCEDKDALQNMTYEESWNYIRNRESMESIKRHTNFNILLNKLREQM